MRDKIILAGIKLTNEGGAYIMNEFKKLLKRVYPDLLEQMQQRYKVMHSVMLLQPIGRRSLVDVTKLKERTIRSEVEFLQEQNLLQTTNKGMYLTSEGKVLLEKLTPKMKEFSGINKLETALKEKLGVEYIIIVPGDSDRHEWIKYEMGKACVHYLKNILLPDSIIAVTGGTTIAAIADAMVPIHEENNYVFVPARGGIGEEVEHQANTIAAKMAHKTNGKYRMLFIPDILSEQSYETMMKEPSIHEILQQIKGANIVLHGIGNALTMAKRRNTPTETMEQLEKGNAVSEAFGYYFDDKGQIVHKIYKIGIQLDDLMDKNHVIAIAGGSSKAKAIASYFKKGKSNMLITDEAAASQLLRDSSL